MNGIIENDIKITPLDLIKNGISLQGNYNDSRAPFDNNPSIIRALISDNISNNLPGLFKSGLIFMNVEIKSYPLGEIRGQIIDKVEVLKRILVNFLNNNHV